MAYTGVSIVDYLKSVGKPSDFVYRSKLAAQKGIANYTGTAAQNTQLLNILRLPVSTPPYTPYKPAPAAAPPVAPPAPISTPTQSTTPSFSAAEAEWFPKFKSAGYTWAWIQFPTGEKNWYRLENGQYIRKSSETEAKIPFTQSAPVSTPKQVTISIEGKPVTVPEVRPGLFGELGYEYSGAPPAPPAPALSAIEAGIKKATETFAGIQKQAAPLLMPVPAKDLTVANVPPPTIPPPTAPSVTTAYTESAMKDLENKRKAIEDVYAKQKADLEKKIAESEVEIKKTTEKQKGMIETDIQPLLQPFREEKEKSERERLKVEENYFANQRSTEELESLLTTLQSEITAAQEVTGLTAIRTPRINKLKEDVAARVGIIQAVMSARSGQISAAETLIDRSITAITADRTDQLAYYTTLYNFYENTKNDEGKKLITLESDKKDFLKSQIALIENDLKASQENVNYIKNLMIEPKTADAMEQAGVKLTDSIPEISKKLADYDYKQDRIKRIQDITEKGYHYLPTSAQQVGKPVNELFRIKDSRGNEMVFWKKEKVTGGKLLSNTQEARLAAAGISPELGAKLTAAILSGATLDEIRQALRQDGINPAVLDTFDRVVGISTLLKTAKGEL